MSLNVRNEYDNLIVKCLLRFSRRYVSIYSRFDFKSQLVYDRYFLILECTSERQTPYGNNLNTNLLSAHQPDKL